MHQQKILLLENVASQAAGVREQLTRAGYQVAVSRYESDGLKRLAEWHPDLVLVSTAHPAGDFVEYCLRARPLAPAARFVVTSPLGAERLFQEHPGLQAVVDGVLPRPYSHEDAAALLAPGPVGPSAALQAAVGRLVVVLDRDPEFAALLRRGLEPHGVQVAVVPFEGIGTFCDAHRPAVVILEWPVPPEFIAGPLARIRASQGARVAVLLLADSSQESVSGSAPALLQTVDMFFRKPVAWEPFFRLLARHLGVPAIAALKPEVALAPPAAPDGDALRAEFQRQLEAKFLEVEELKRQLAAAARQAPSAPQGVAWLQSENEQLRQAIREGERKSGLTLATEQLKRSEIEVKLDNLLRMKEDFEFRAQNEIEERSRQIEELQGQLRELRAGADGAVAERDALRAQLERALVEKEQIEERLHSFDAGGPPGSVPAQAAAPGAAEPAATVDEIGRWRAAAAESQAALADVSAQAAVLEESLARERTAREELARELVREREGAAVAATRVGAERERDLAQLQALREEIAQEKGTTAELQRRLSDADSAAAAARTALAAANDRRTTLEKELDDERTARAAAEARGSTSELGAAAADERGREAAAERDRLQRRLEERELTLGGEVRAWREKAEAAALELDVVRGQAAERAEREEGERRQFEARAIGAEAAAQSAEAAAREAEAGAREAQVVAREAQDMAREAEGRRALAEQSLRSEREDSQAREEEARARLAAQQALNRELEQRLAARPSEEAAAAVPVELRRIQELLEEVIARARTDAIEHARRDAELTVKLATAVEERRLLQERFDRAAAEAAERERRSAALLQSAIDRGPSAAPARDNLPAVVPAEAEPGVAGRRRLLAGLAAAAIVVALLFLAVRRSLSPPGGDAQPARPPAAAHQPEAPPEPPPAGVAPVAPAAGVAGTPREVWDRWTRSDSSGGVLLQATLRSEAEVRAEVEAERRSRGWSGAEAQAALARRLGTFRFDSTYYLTVYAKNLSPGYPAYFDDFAARVRLRDSTGREAPAFLPPGQEAERRVYSFGTGAPADRVYEATVPLGFSRTGLATSPAYLQLIVTNVGASSRRVLTWELE